MAFTLWRNPLEIWNRAHFDLPILIGKTPLGLRAAVSDPQAIRRVLLENAANYRKDALQLRVLRPGLGDGLLTVEGEAWKSQRRALAPMFSPRQVGGIRRRDAQGDARGSRARGCGASRRAARRCDSEMALITLQVLEQTLFSRGLGRDATEFQHAVTRYFDTFGRLDPLDLLGAPKFLPRSRAPSRPRSRSRSSTPPSTRSSRAPQADRIGRAAAGRSADAAVARRRSRDGPAHVASRRALQHRHLHQRRPRNDRERLSWTLYLLSQAPDWRTRVEAEVDAGFRPRSDKDPIDDLPVTRAAIEEAMRLYPPAAILSREAIGEDWLCGSALLREPW